MPERVFVAIITLYYTILGIIGHILHLVGT